MPFDVTAFMTVLVTAFMTVLVTAFIDDCVYDGVGDCVYDGDDRTDVLYKSMTDEPNRCPIQIDD